MSESLEKKLIEDLEKSGFMLEVDVLNELMEKGWIVYPQYTYVASQTNKIRAIDMVAHPIEFYRHVPRLMIECKSTKEKNWVFFIPPVISFNKDVQDLKQLNSINMTFLKANISLQSSLCKFHPEVLKNSDPVKKLEVSCTIIPRTHFTNRVPLAYACHVSHIKNSGARPEDEINGFRNAVLQLNSAYLGTKLGDDSPVFLCIVFRGNMFALDEKKNLKLVKHIAFVNLTEENNVQAPPAYIDVVSDSYFLTYLDIIKKDMDICIGRDRK